MVNSQERSRFKVHGARVNARFMLVLHMGTDFFGFIPIGLGCTLNVTAEEPIEEF